MGLIKIPVGDWSDDGHGKCETIIIDSNYPAAVLQEAYKASCRLMGISFNHNEDFTCLGGSYSEANERRICTEYEDAQINDYCLGKLVEFGFDNQDIIEDAYFEDAETFVKVLLWFIGKSAPSDWEWKLTVDDKVEVLNGYWNKGLNVQFGYGLFN